MIVTCPECSAKFRVADEKLTGNKVALRCARCRKVFSLDPLAQPKTPVASAKEFILVAHADPGLLQTIAAILAQHQIEHVTADNGDAALQQMDKRPPTVAIVDVALPGLYAFEVVEKVRSRPGLEHVKIILLSSVYNKMAYKRTPGSLYGADDYLEKHHLPDSLVPKIRRLSAIAQQLEPPARAAADDWEEVNQAIRQAEEQEVTPAGKQQAVEKARRLARIIVSDIALYNQERIEEGVATGRALEMFTAELEEGQRLFSARVAEDIASQEDFLLNAFREFINTRGLDEPA